MQIYLSMWLGCALADKEKHSHTTCAGSCMGLFFLSDTSLKRWESQRRRAHGQQAARVKPVAGAMVMTKCETVRARERERWKAGFNAIVFLCWHSLVLNSLSIRFSIRVFIRESLPGSLPDFLYHTHSSSLCLYNNLHRILSRVCARSTYSRTRIRPLRCQSERARKWQERARILQKALNARSILPLMWTIWISFGWQHTLDQLARWQCGPVCHLARNSTRNSAGGSVVGKLSAVLLNFDSKSCEHTRWEYHSGSHLYRRRSPLKPVCSGGSECCTVCTLCMEWLY